MSKMVTIKEFIKLSYEEKLEAYPSMSDHDKFLWRTQYEPIGGTVIGYEESTPEEEAEAERVMDEWLKRIGVIE